MTSGMPFPYRGDAQKAAAITAALRRVIDPEMALGIVDLGLVYGVEASEDEVRIRLTMTSAACPVAEAIMEDVAAELDAALGPACRTHVELCWNPPWRPEMMSGRARHAMGFE